uniref:hypothetical protein n=1 Tax=Eubacterium cellulosolvens TaxID=29322 RepID=UPI0005566A7C
MRKKSKQVVGILLSLVLAIGLMPGMSMTARAEEGQGQEGSVIVNNVEYLADRTFDGKEIMKEHDCIKITSDTTELKPGEWYVVDGEVNIEKRVEGPKKDCSDDEADKAHLILKDGAVLRIPKGIHGHCIDFYGQKNSTGQLIIDNVENGYQGIGTNFEESGFHDEELGNGGNGGFFGFYGGTIRITGGKGAAAIYGVMNFFELKGGSLQITGGEGAPAESRVAMESSVGVHVIAYEGDNNQGNVVYRGMSYPTWKDTNKLYFELADYHHTYRTTNEGRTVTLDCDVCNPTGTTPAGINKVTICAPTLKKYGETGEGINAEATLDYAGGQEGRQMTDAAIISYFKTDSSGNKTGDALDKAPTDIGTYWAEFTLGEGENQATAHVVYTISSEVSRGDSIFNDNDDVPEITFVEYKEIKDQLASIAAAELAKETGAIENNQTREVKVTMDTTVVSKKDATGNEKIAIEAVEQAAENDVPEGDRAKMQIAFLNINVKKAVIINTVTDGQESLVSNTETTMSTLPQVVDIPVYYNMTGKFNAKVARYHDGVAQVFTKLKTRPAKNALKDGTYWVEGSGENTIVHIYSSEFSTYALFTSGTKEYVTEDTSNKPS